jgi:hypothetical protein
VKLSRIAVGVLSGVPFIYAALKGIEQGLTAKWLIKNAATYKSVKGDSAQYSRVWYKANPNGSACFAAHAPQHSTPFCSIHQLTTMLPALLQEQLFKCPWW